MARDGARTQTGALALPQRQVLADDVYDTIKAALLSNRIEPGARLVLDRLAAQLGVSNTPIRQALSRLESEGLIVKQPYRGFTASRLLDHETLDDMYEFRLLLEPAIAAKAAARSRPADLDQLRQAAGVQVPSDVAQDHPLMERARASDAAFHVCLADIAGNGVISESLARLFQRTTVHRIHHRSGAEAQAWREHQEVIEAVAAADAARAAEAMAAHLAAARERLRRLFD